MNISYSPKLITRCQKIFRKKTGRKITPGQAELILDRLAKLGLLSLKGGDEYVKDTSAQCE